MKKMTKTEREALVQLGVAAITGKVPSSLTSKCSVGDIQSSFHEKMIELAPNKLAFQENQYAICEILQEVYSAILPQRIALELAPFAEFIQVDNGQQIVFKQRVGKGRGKSFVTKVGLGGIFETFRLDNKDFHIETEAYGGAAVLDWERLLAGQDVISEYADVLLEGIMDRIYELIASALNASANATRPTNTVFTANTFDDAEFAKIVTAVSAYCPSGTKPTIFATQEFIDTIPGNYLAVTSGGTTSIKISSNDVEDIRLTGAIKFYRGCPIVPLKQSFTDESNETKVLDPKYCYIIPAGTKPVHIGLEGGIEFDTFKNKDRSLELSGYQKVGAAINSYNNWGIYENTSLV